jgi:predicted esterase
MLKAFRNSFAASAVALLGLACSPWGDPAPEPSAPVVAVDPTKKPEKPLALPAPPPPSADFQGADLSKVPGDRLAAAANQFAQQGNPREAARFQYWAVKAGAGSVYNLACWTALAGDQNGAFHWLQEAAIEDGVDADWAEQDSDLESLRKDARWKQIVPYLKQCNAFWAVSGVRQTVLVLPNGYQVGTPIGVLVGMHGMGHHAEGFIDKETYQAFADELNMAIVGVSGTVPTGRRSFVWSENPQKDAEQVRSALASLSGQLTAKQGHIINFGFSQGAQLGFEVAFQNPDEFRGAIVMSPGTTNRFLRLAKLKATPKNKPQGYVFLCGAGEAPGNVTATKNDAELAERAGARVELKLYEGMDKHTFPPDFAANFARWVRFIEGEGPKPE